MNYELYLTATFIKHANVLCQIIPYSHLILNTLNTGSLLKVTLDDDLKLAQGSREGYYTLNSMENGKQTWTQVQGSNAIWYNKEHKNWMIGPNKIEGTPILKLAMVKR